MYILLYKIYLKKITQVLEKNVVLKKMLAIICNYKKITSVHSNSCTVNFYNNKLNYFITQNLTLFVKKYVIMSHLFWKVFFNFYEI